MKLVQILAHFGTNFGKSGSVPAFPLEYRTRKTIFALRFTVHCGASFVCRRFAFVAMVFITLFGACTSLAIGIAGPQHNIPEERSPAQTIVKDGLENAVFQELPPQAYHYLQVISAAFQRRDEPFLLDQGEKSFTDWATANLDGSPEILAHLFRAGLYAADSPDKAPHLPSRLIIRETRGITYLGWDERGPLIEVRAQIMMKNGAIPARLLVVWRLDEPKLQGYVE
jgi:hypothetical protein